ncbi:hypothetical protein GGS23DRAFT_611965 [Durotheca rogersii]|uniref:uncharacterized protein n=1 Tax=Durotheca rogersii TaxID=419775 RepID=UPI00221E76BA|nr:uncharacterized protein GGS23DRAFT_611965 [Durotheca rogersii]KAI5861424.1 hypothetical protein GGS23DRAFT_611965 [Durotheca rogersii]
MHPLQIGHIALYVAAAATPVALALPTTTMKTIRQEAGAGCAELSTTRPNWKITHAASSDWPGGGGGRVELFAQHVPTGVTAACDVEYRLDGQTGAIVGHDPTAAHDCLNFGAADLLTSVRLDMDTLTLSLRSRWACDDSAAAPAPTYIATGVTALARDTSPGACLVEPSQVGDSTTCPIADVEVQGELTEHDW